MINAQDNLLARRVLICALVLGMAVVAIAVAFAAPGDNSLDDIRQQATIKSSYNFSPLPPTAGKGITIRDNPRHGVGRQDHRPAY
jgi:hypothetical protein